MATTADAVIIGGGVIGTSILYNLALQGLRRIVLLEKDVLASGSTGRSQAILRMHYSNEVTTRLAWESLKLFKEFNQLTGVSSGYKQTGYLVIVNDEDELALKTNIDMQKKLGVNTGIISPTEVKELAPMISMESDEVYAFEPESGYADPYALTTGYAQKARELGAIIKMHSPVINIETKKGKINRVITAKETIETPIVVIAAGPWSGPILHKLGVTTHLVSVRHQIIRLKRPYGKIPYHPILGDIVNSLSARPDLSDLTLIGVGEDEVAEPETYNRGIDMPIVEETFRKITKRMPDMGEASFMGGWSGLFTVTPDWHPILDAIKEIEGLYCAIGFSGHGFKLSPMVGQVMAELITQPSFQSIDISMLGLGRFEAGRLLASRYNLNVLA